MLTIHQAEHIAVDYLINLQNQIGMPLQIIKTINVSSGWVFLYNTKAFIESGEIGLMLAGNAPFLIDADDGSLHVFGTAHPLEVYLKQYDQKKTS